MAENKIRIVFMGTPEFAVPSLAALVEQEYDVCGVVTAPDSRSGRGQKLKTSAVKDYAVSKDLKVLQPVNLKEEAFLQELNELNATLFIVVAFRMLPESVWTMPPLGTFNLHASLLPQYRGAAPINRTIMNGERLGGLTTFFLQHAIDTGNVIFRVETDISKDENAGEYHDRLKVLGADLVIRTVEAIRTGNVNTVRQEDLLSPGEELKKAQKIYKEDCRINWEESAEKIYNQIRGLSPYPGAFTEITTADGREIYLKIFRASLKDCSSPRAPGHMKTDGKTYLNFCCGDGCISVLEVQQAGKKRMKISDFLLGLSFRDLN
jgi:methionyl-tRNA formyltransferase